VKEAKTSLKRYHRCRNDANEESLRLAEREKATVIQRAKTFAFREGVHKASMSSKEVWSLAKWGSKRSTPPREIPKLPALEIKGQKTKAVTFEAKVKVLQETFFPPPLNADLDDIAGTRYPPPLSMNDIDEKEVIQAINRPAQDKAPGVNGIPNRFLRAVAGELCSHIRHLFQACLRMGHHPKRFKEANTVVLKKPKKSDYSQPKSYRPIALLDTLGKAFETRERLRNLLPEEQMRARRGRSVETALETITEAVHTIWNCNKNIVASLFSLNGAGAFDNVSHARLLHNLRMKGVPSLIVHWVKSFLEDRATSITLGMRTSPMIAVQTGIPQGSPVSPILFLFFNAPLIEACTRANLPTGGFVDDVQLLAYGKSTERNCEVLSKAHEICPKWARTHGASFAPQKYELLHLFRRPKKVNMAMFINFGTTFIEPRTSIRILGLHIDGKLKWEPHVTQLN